MSAPLDLSGTAGLPVPSDLEESASAVLRCGSIVNESIRRAHTKWSYLAEAYAAPEQQRVQRAMDPPRDAGEAVFQAATHAASALGVFAASVEVIRQKRLELQAEAEVLYEKENQGKAAGVLPAECVALTLPWILLQDRADQLAQELSTAEDECIRTLTRWERHSAGSRIRGH